MKYAERSRLRLNANDSRREMATIDTEVSFDCDPKSFSEFDWLHLARASMRLISAPSFNFPYWIAIENWWREQQEECASSLEIYLFKVRCWENAWSKQYIYWNLFTRYRGMWCKIGSFVLCIASFATEIFFKYCYKHYKKIATGLRSSGDTVISRSILPRFQPHHSFPCEEIRKNIYGAISIASRH